MGLTIHHLDEEPGHRVRVLNARPGGGAETAFVPVLRGVVDGLPEPLEGLVLASDLQGVAPDDEGRLELCSVAVVDALVQLELDGAVPPLAACGAVLAGDLYSVPDATKRGGFGDVASAWRAFARRCAWVAGVAGNHDDVRRLPAEAVLLDGDVRELGGLRVGGVGRICGNPAKPGRRDEAHQLAAIALVKEAAPDLLVLHEGPAGGQAQRGHPAIPLVPGLTVCGHVHWERPWYRHAHGDVLNVEGRVVVLTRRPC
ncbi:MAG: metallophosphoesterase [Myxococcota bacterium]